MFILASTSQTRKDLLHNAGLNFASVKPEIDEKLLHQKYSTLSPTELAPTLAAKKSGSLSLQYSEQLIIGADQILHLNDNVLHKPSNLDEARKTLQNLRGKTHHLTTAIACHLGGRQIWQHQAQAKLTMRKFSDDFLETYLTQKNQKALKSAGVYQLETNGIQLFEKIEGDYFTILGFPLLEFLEFLRTRSVLLK